MATSATAFPYKRFIWAGVILAIINVIGTIGYWFIGGKQYSLLDCFYMTFITVATIGYGEIIDLSNHAGGRVFTMFIALAGIGVLTYSLSMFTAMIVEGQLKETFARRKMEKAIQRLKDHFIICGFGRVGRHIMNELLATQRPHVVIDIHERRAEDDFDPARGQIFLRGDATNESTLLQAGIMKAKGVFATTGDDSLNLMISLTAKHLHPDVRVVARCGEPRNIDKMKKAGADSVISPAFIGALRMASDMIRPAVVSFLDTMLRDTEKNLRVEEIPVPARFIGQPLSALKLGHYPNTLVIAIKVADGWLYKPPAHYIFKLDNVLVIITNPEERLALEKALGSGV
jgi:voltage-gated potassium channel